MGRWASPGFGFGGEFTPRDRHQPAQSRFRAGPTADPGVATPTSVGGLADRATVLVLGSGNSRTRILGGWIGQTQAQSRLEPHGLHQDAPLASVRLRLGTVQEVNSQVSGFVRQCLRQERPVSGCQKRRAQANEATPRIASRHRGPKPAGELHPDTGAQRGTSPADRQSCQMPIDRLSESSGRRCWCWSLVVHPARIRGQAAAASPNGLGWQGMTANIASTDGRGDSETKAFRRATTSDGDRRMT
jgi:hypothetical protein